VNILLVYIIYFVSILNSLKHFFCIYRFKFGQRAKVFDYKLAIQKILRTD